MWQPIETAPKDGTRILMTDGNLVSIGAWEEFSDHWSTWSCEAEPRPTDGPGACAGWWDVNPTGWMPLPDARQKIS